MMFSVHMQNLTRKLLAFEPVKKALTRTVHNRLSPWIETSGDALAKQAQSATWVEKGKQHTTQFVGDLLDKTLPSPKKTPKVQASSLRKPQDWLEGLHTQIQDGFQQMTSEVHKALATPATQVGKQAFKQHVTPQVLPIVTRATDPKHTAPLIQNVLEGTLRYLKHPEIPPPTRTLTTLLQLTPEPIVQQTTQKVAQQGAKVLHAGGHHVPDLVNHAGEYAIQQGTERLLAHLDLGQLGELNQLARKNPQEILTLLGRLESPVARRMQSALHTKLISGDKMTPQTIVKLLVEEGLSGDLVKEYPAFPQFVQQTLQQVKPAHAKGVRGFVNRRFTEPVLHDLEAKLPEALAWSLRDNRQKLAEHVVRSIFPQSS